MLSFSYTIKDEVGIHARPAGLLAKEAKKYESKIVIKKDGKAVEAARIMAVMGLGVKNGQEVVFTFDGEDEDAACEAVSKFMKENL